jgi:hypothetical protein
VGDLPRDGTHRFLPPRQEEAQKFARRPRHPIRRSPSEPIKIVPLPRLTVILHEAGNSHRQIYTDGPLVDALAAPAPRNMHKFPQSGTVELKVTSEAPLGRQRITFSRRTRRGERGTTRHGAVRRAAEAYARMISGNDSPSSIRA